MQAFPSSLFCRTHASEFSGLTLRWQPRGNKYHASYVNPASQNKNAMRGLYHLRILHRQQCREQTATPFVQVNSSFDLVLHKSITCPQHGNRNPWKRIHPTHRMYKIGPFLCLHFPKSHCGTWYFKYHSLDSENHNYRFGNILCAKLSSFCRSGSNGPQIGQIE